MVWPPPPPFHTIKHRKPKRSQSKYPNPWPWDQILSQLLLSFHVTGPESPPPRRRRGCLPPEDHTMTTRTVTAAEDDDDPSMKT
ncbi:hypothetical protein V6N12_048151 [Hibiscus sabdariffa]|uniref:Uncharacterized protein n=1 Tax=Hibiscus sabdariffa TaxID=183260 RepID=A0ABR2EGG3_9ROSI